MDRKPSLSEEVRRWVTPTLLPPQWQLALSAVVSVLEGCGVKKLITMHGWTESEFEDHPSFTSLQWVDVPISPAELQELLDKRRVLGFTLGQDDWWITGRAAAPFEFLCCHESDLHLETADPQVAARLKVALAADGLDLEEIIR